MVQIVIYYPYLDGTTTSLIDTYFNLKRYMSDVECYIVIDPKNIKQNVAYLKQVHDSVPNSFKYTSISIEQLFQKKWDKLIMSFGVFRFLDKLPTHYNKLFLLDAGRVCRDYFCNNGKCINYVKTLKNVSVYGNKVNKQLFGNFNSYYLWYHKFSRERFDFLKQLQVKHRTASMSDRLNTGNIPFETLFADELFYERYDRTWGSDEPLYHENIGKLIFEFSALNKKVMYSSNNKKCDDGLTEYLSLFGINDNIEQEIHITEELLFDKLGMKQDDILLSHIRNV
jgi:hypothetical protein